MVLAPVGGMKPFRACAMFRQVLLLTALLVSVGCTDLGPSRVDVPVDSAAGEVEFTLAGGGGAALVVPVHLNGTGPYDFVLDTGATLTCVNEDLARELQLESVHGVSGVAAGVGGSGQIELVRVDSVRMGQAAAHDLEACVIDLQHLHGIGLEIDGLLGLNLLRSFRVGIDFERSVVTLAPP